jgi:hypothetical protein
MGLVFAHEPIPLQALEDGVVRVGGTRVTLDTVVIAFEQGATAEEIVLQYPSARGTQPSGRMGRPNSLPAFVASSSPLVR